MLSEIPELRHIVVKKKKTARSPGAGLAFDRISLAGDHQRRISQRPTFVDVVRGWKRTTRLKLKTVIPSEREERVAARETRLPGRVDDDRPAGGEELGPGTGKRLGLG